MARLKLIGEINCHQCKKPIEIDESMGVYNFIGNRCPHCNAWNVVKVIINDGEVNKNI